MTSNQQRHKMHRQLWQVANQYRSSVDGWDFKQFVLGMLFYRFISENVARYIEASDRSINYATWSDEVITAKIKDDAIQTKGYFIYPSQLFINVAKNANTNRRLCNDLDKIFSEIEASANGYPSEGHVKDLFADFSTSSYRLGNSVAEKNARLAKVLEGVSAIDFGDSVGDRIGMFGDAAELLLSSYAATSFTFGSEAFTPLYVSKLIVQLAMHKQTSINRIYDPACGTGSLLLQAKENFDARLVEDGFWGQEVNRPTHILARMNMFLHDVSYNKFEIALGNTLTSPQFGDDKPFDAIVCNPPYSMRWVGEDDPTLINDDRFSAAGVLPPSSQADYAFILHALNYLSAKGRATIVCFPGIFFRGGAEKEIRKYLVDNNYVETIILLAPNLFYHTAYSANILVLAKHKPDTSIQFIDARGPEFFTKEINNNVMLDEHIQKVIDIFNSKVNISHVAASVPHEQIKKNDYDLTLGYYLEPRDPRDSIDIVALNAEIKSATSKIDRLRTGVDAITVEIEA